MPEPLRRGVFAALWTPTDSAGHPLDDALRRHLAFLQSAGVDGVLALGSTGEFVHLAEAERAALLARIVELAGPMAVLANVSDVNPATAGRLARAAKSAGCVGLAVLPPWYFALSQEDQLEFFLRVAAATDLPVCLYNFPERTGNRIALETIAAFAERAPLFAVKQSGAEWAYHRELIALGREKNFAVFTGSDTRFAEALALGCAGCISGLANFVPEALVQVLAAVPAGADTTEPMRLLQRVGAACGALNFPLDVAAGMRARGFEMGEFKQAVSAATRVKFDRLTADLRLLLGEAGLLG
jgi:4-hydroxy-tetrahydrodipicolinate synthase